MTDFGDKLVGIYHFLTDRAPRSIPLVGARPRPVNPWLRNGQALVAKVMPGGDIRASIEKAIALLGALQQAIGKGDRVLVKPNLNSQDPYPGSTDLGFLRAIVEADNKLVPDPWQSAQVITALRHGLGTGGNRYIVVE